MRKAFPAEAGPGHWVRGLVLAAMVGLTGCAGLNGASPELGTEGMPSTSAPSPAPDGAGAQAEPDDAAPAGPEEAGEAEMPVQQAEIVEGSGVFMDEEVAGIPLPRPNTATGEITLNFEKTPLEEVVKVVLGEMLESNYVIEPGVKGQVTLQTTHPVRKVDLMPILERLLRMNGAALVTRAGMYHVVPFAQAVKGASPRLGKPFTDLPPGTQVRVVPLKYIAASEMQEILKPLLPPNALVRVDRQRNLLMLAGTSKELQRLIHTVTMFDVDWMDGMSVALFPIQNADATKVAEELKSVFGEGGQTPVSGMFRFLPVERINSVLVITHRAEYLKKAEKWLERLDRGQAAGRMLHVYRVKNVKAADLAAILDEIVQGGSGASKERQSDAQLAPGAEKATVATEGAEDKAKAAAPREQGQAAGASAPPAGEGVALSDLGDVRVIADETNNALVVLATRREYDVIEQALDRLDVLPRQVLVEATIMEVSLTDDLQYGLQWFFKNGVDDYQGKGTFSSGDSSQLASSFPGFSYSLVDNAGSVRAVFNALKEKTNLNVLSSPSLMVLDNQAATIKVGDQVPVRTSESTNTATSGSNPIVTSSIQYRDTGVLLKVKPRVNPGGLVIMEVQQEVNDVSSTTSSGIDSPTIQQRQIDSTVAIKGGQTVVLGGLIRNNQSTGNSGVPVLGELPGIGALFSQRSRSHRRTELVVLITPRVVVDEAEANAVTEQFRSRLKGLEAWASGNADDDRDDNSAGDHSNGEGDHDGATGVLTQ